MAGYKMAIPSVSEWENTQIPSDVIPGIWRVRHVAPRGPGSLVRPQADSDGGSDLNEKSRSWRHHLLLHPEPPGVDEQEELTELKRMEIIATGLSHLSMIIGQLIKFVMHRNSESAKNKV